MKHLSDIHDAELGWLRAQTIYHYVMDDKVRISAFRPKLPVTFALRIDPAVRRRLTKFHHQRLSWLVRCSRDLKPSMETALAAYYRKWREHWGDEVRNY